MHIRLFNKHKGISICELPADYNGVREIAFPDADGHIFRLLDAVGDREKWTLHAKKGCQIKLLEINGDEFGFSGETANCTFADGLACQITNGDGEVFFALCTDTENANDVFLISLPLDRQIAIGYSSSCGIQTDFPVVNDLNTLIERKLDGLLIRSNNNSETFLNGDLILSNEGEVRAQIGDAVDIYGLRIVFMGDFAALYAYAGKLSGANSKSAYHTRINRVFPLGRKADQNGEEIFNRSPRIYMKHDVPKFNIDSPPNPEKMEDMPIILTIGSSAMMGMASIMMATMSMQNAIQSNASIASVLPSVFMSTGMFVGSLLMPLLNRRYTNKQKQKREKIRREKYLRYLNDIVKRIYDAGEYQRQLLEETYPTLDVLKERTYSRNEHLWERMLNHEDFLDLRLGRAKLDIDMDINDPGEHFSMDDDDIREAFEAFMHDERCIDNAPFMLQLRKTKVLGLFGNRALRMRYVKELMMQLCIQHSYKELKFVVLYPASAEKEWEFARWLPHCWNDEKSMRFIGCTVEDMQELSIVLQNMCFSERVTRKEEETLHTVIVIADKQLSERCRSLVNAMKNLEGYPVSIIALAEKPGELPKECRSVIALKENGGALFKDINQMEKAIGFSYDMEGTDLDIRQLAIKLRHTHLAGEEAEGVLPNSLSYFDMMRCGNVRQLNAPARWKNSNPIKTLAAPVGVDKDGGMLTLDIHQKAHGPHGLVAGTTGSGKSEFLITYLLSMALYYDPLEVGFVLIDYKGGGMSDTLKLLPHVVGVIDNLGGKQGIHRAMVSITNELKRRQRIFKEASEKLNVKNIDIHTYQKLFRSGKVDEPLQHLIIVSDEFAELKQQEPDFMDDLVSAARIGRSLGVHLILATQKPTGVVNDQILSNTRFRICMKVQDRSDSMSMIGKPDAAFITKTGRFYLQVGMDELYLLGQSAWSGADATDKEDYTLEPDRAIEVLNNQGNSTIKAIPEAYVPKRQEGVSALKQVDAIVGYLAETAQTLKRQPKPIWLPILSDNLTIEAIEKKYAPAFDRWALDPVIGEVDDPVAQSQYALQLNLTAGNMVVMGNAGTGQERFVEGAIYSLCMHHSPDDVHIYSLDFASETTRVFLKMPHVGDVMCSGDDEKITNFFNWLDKECARRRALISNFGGSLEMMHKNSTEALPNILVIIQNYAAFIETYERFEDVIYSLVRDASSFGIYFLVTAANSRAVRSKLLQSFRQTYCLQMTDELEYINLLGKNDGVVPMKRVGSGIFTKDGRVLEFQTASIFNDPNLDYSDEIQRLSSEMAVKWKGHEAGRVRVLPETVRLKDISSDASAIALSSVPVGIHRTRLDTVYWDIETNHLNLMLYRDKPEFRFLESFASMLNKKPTRHVCVLDAAGLIDAHYPADFEIARSDDEICTKANEAFETALSRRRTEKSMAAEGKTPTFEELVVIVCSMRRLSEILKAGESTITQLSEKFDAFLERSNKRLGISIILVGRSDELSGFSIRTWYQSVNRSNGLWLGSGIINQQLLNQSNVGLRDTLPDGPYGYMVKNEKAQCCKLLETLM